MKNPLFSISIALCLMSASVANAAPAPFVIAKDRQPQAVIVVDKALTNAVRTAALELAKYFEKISGASFMVLDKPVPGFRTIRVGSPYKASKPDEICIRVADANTLEVTGNGPRGTLYAAYDLIESFGVVFCAPEYEHIPTTNLLEVAGDYSKVDAPVFEWRSAWGELNNNFEFACKNRIHPGRGCKRWPELGGSLPYNISQSLPGRYISGRKYFKDHPGWFAYDRATGKRRANWVCASSEEMYGQLFREVEEFIQKNPGSQVSLGVSDGARMCECDDCLALAARYPEKTNGAHNQHIQELVIVNRVAKHFAQKYPDVRFNFLCYGDEMPSNPDFHMEPNTGAGVAELWRNHCLPADNNERSDSALGQLCRMSPPGNGVYVWDYLANFANYMIPFPNHNILGQTLRYYDRLGVKGVDSQTAFGVISDMSTLNFWLFGKLHWNPYQNDRALASKYVQAAYGKGAKQIEEYLDILEHARLRQRYTWFGCYVPGADHYLTPEDSVRILKLFESAEYATRGTPHRLLVRRAKVGALLNAIFQYNDMVEPAARMKFKLRPLAELREEWKQICFDSSNWYGSSAYAEHPWTYPQWGKWTEAIVTNAPLAAAAAKPQTRPCVVIPAAKMTGGSKMTLMHDSAGFDFARIKVSLTNDVNDLWMTPSYGEAGHTVMADEAGDWYVFATLRTATMVPRDQAACYFGIYRPIIANGIVIRKRAEIADMPVSAWGGEDGWRTLCLGKRRLYENTRVWVMNGILNPVDHVDVKDFTFVAPEIVEKAFAREADAKPRTIVIDAPKFDRDKNVRVETDKIDNFKYARLAAFNTNAPVASVSYTVKPAEAGRWHVLLRTRIGAAVALDQDAALATITAPPGGAENGAPGTVARAHVTGSLGDEAWQIVSLGVVDLAPGMKINLLPVGSDTNAPPRFTDIQFISLIDPAYIGKTQNVAP